MDYLKLAGMLENPNIDVIVNEIRIGKKKTMLFGEGIMWEHVSKFRFLLECNVAN